MEDETEVEISGPLGPVCGTLCGASFVSAKSVVVIVPGSGPTDRNGNNALGVPAATYKMLAQLLYSNGIPSIRYDKRGLFASERAIRNANAVTIKDYVDDLGKWASLARNKFVEAKVVALGHSEGGLISLVAAKEDQNVNGLILAASPGRPMGEVLLEQLKRQLDGPSSYDSAAVAIKELTEKRIVDLSSIPKQLHLLFHNAIQPFLMDLFQYDPGDLISKINQKTLILQGLQDVQVHKGDAERLKLGKPDAELHLLPEMNHLLKRQEGASPSVVAKAYTDPDHPLDEALQSPIIKFIRGLEKADL